MSTRINKQKETLRSEAENLMKKIILEKKIPADKIYEIYNRIFGADETSSKCISCIERKVAKIKGWLKNDRMKSGDEKQTLKEELTRRLIRSAESLPVGLFNGKTGLCLHLFNKSRLTSDNDMEWAALKILDIIIADLKKSVSLDLENGIIGIAISLDYLMKNKFIANNVNAMLNDTDSWIIAQINKRGFRANSSLLLHLIYYFTMRLKDQEKGSDKEFIFQEIVIGMVNELHTGKHDSLFEEPLSFSLNYQLPVYIYVLRKVYELDFYNYRIIKILEEVSVQVITYIPLLHSHRLSLLYAMKSVTSQVDLDGWENHVRILKQEVNLQHILQKELLDCHTGIMDGVAGIYFLLKSGNKLLAKNEQISFAPELFVKRINQSEIWRHYADDLEFFNHNSGLAYGLCGILFTLDDMENMS